MILQDDNFEPSSRTTIEEIRDPDIQSHTTSILSTLNGQSNQDISEGIIKICGYALKLSKYKIKARNTWNQRSLSP